MSTIIASDLIARALRKAGILASGQTADANDALEALDTANDIIDQWALEDLMLTNSDIISFALVSGTIQYTIGATGTIVAARPIEILNAWIRTADNLDIPMEVVAYETYQNTIQKENTQTTYPSLLAYQPSMPLGYIYLWQTPASGLTLRLLVNTYLEAIADLATSLTLAPGVSKALIDTLAYTLCVEYGRDEMLEALRQEALMSKMNVKRKNTKKTSMRLDSSLLLGTRRPYNPYSDK